LLPGDVGCLYGMLYPIGRFILEFQRAEPDLWRIAGIPTAQIIAIVVFLFCAGTMAYRHFVVRQKPQGAESEESPSVAEEPITAEE
jgi:prolipoprotein diacylglyceryltransferase